MTLKISIPTKATAANAVPRMTPVLIGLDVPLGDAGKLVDVPELVNDAAVEDSDPDTIVFSEEDKSGLIT